MLMVVLGCLNVSTKRRFGQMRLQKFRQYLDNNRFTLAALAVVLLVLALMRIHLIATRKEVNRPIRIVVKGFYDAPKPLQTTLPTTPPKRAEAKQAPSVKPPVKTEDSISPLDFGMHGKTLVPTKDGLVLAFNISRSEYDPGFDPKIIERAFGLNPSQKLYLSLEPLDSTAEEPALRAEIIRNFSFYRGYYASLVLPFSSRPRRHFGVFICSDTNENGRCLGKPVLNLRDLAKAEVGKGKNQIYFFNYLLIEGNRAYALDYSLGDKMYYRLRDYLTEAEGLKGALPGHLETVIKKVIANSFNLRASSMKMKGPAIHIALRKGR